MSHKSDAMLMEKWKPIESPCLSSLTLNLVCGGKSTSLDLMLNDAPLISTMESKLKHLKQAEPEIQAPNPPMNRFMLTGANTSGTASLLGSMLHLGKSQLESFDTSDTVPWQFGNEQCQDLRSLLNFKVQVRAISLECITNTALLMLCSSQSFRPLIDIHQWPPSSNWHEVKAGQTNSLPAWGHQIFCRDHSGLGDWMRF